jgi:hypothetical protein
MDLGHLGFGLAAIAGALHFLLLSASVWTFSDVDCVAYTRNRISNISVNVLLNI